MKSPENRKLRAAGYALAFIASGAALGCGPTQRNTQIVETCVGNCEEPSFPQSEDSPTSILDSRSKASLLTIIDKANGAYSEVILLTNTQERANSSEIFVSNSL